MKTGSLFFFFFFAEHLLVCQLCTNLKSDRSLLSCLKVTQCWTSEIGDAPLYNYRSELWQQDHCQHPQNANLDGSTLEDTTQRTGRPFGGVGAEATSCHLTSSKSAWMSTPKCTWMCWRVWWSPSAIRWPVADPGCGSRTRPGPQVQRDPGLASEGVLRLCTLLSLAPSPPQTWTHWTTSFGHTSRTSPTWPPTTLKPAWSQPSAEYSPSSRRRLWKRPAPSSRLRLMAATLNRCQRYNIMKLLELSFSINVLK